MADDDVHRIKVRAGTVAELRAFLDDSNMDFGCRPVARREGDGIVAEVYATLPQVEQLRAARVAAAGVSVSVIENASEVGRARQAEVGTGNRFAARNAAPRGLGIKE